MSQPLLSVSTWALISFAQFVGVAHLVFLSEGIVLCVAVDSVHLWEERSSGSLRSLS